jgi:CYTH domain-containing protein
MSAEIPMNNPEKKEVLDDNARKFTVDTLDTQFLNENNATSFTLTTDWLTTDEDYEEKVAHKAYDNGDIQILLISKTITDGSRTSEKEKITEEKYNDLLSHSKLRIEKKRYEFTYIQNDVPFSIKYDEFSDNEELRILEVDAASDEKRNSFDPSDFLGRLDEVTGDIRYYGYQVAYLL